MPYPTTEEFKAILKAQSLSEIVREYIFTGEPFAFQKNPASMVKIRRHLTSRLPLAADNIFVIGSAKLGFSLNPDSYFHAFSDESDIDIAIVDTDLFDKVWLNLLDWHYPRRITGLDPINSKWAGDRKKDIYWGWITPHKIRYEGLNFPKTLEPLRDLSAKWFDAFQSFSAYTEFVSRRMESRLYRSWDHALRYHVEGLRSLREFVERLEVK